MKYLISLAVLCIILFSRAWAIQVGGIISANTTWSVTSEPYVIISPIQIPFGVSLTIQPGVSVQGGEIRTFGNLLVQGNAVNMATFTNVNIKPGSSTPSQNHQIVIRFANLVGGSLYSPTGNGIYGSLTLEDSVILNLPDMYIWYPTSPVAIKRNIFKNFGGISMGSSASSVTIENNYFDSSCAYAVECWAAYNSVEMIVRYNTFEKTSSPRLILPPAYSSSRMDGRNNYWSTTNTSEISTMIFDKNVDLASADYILFQPFLTAPHPYTAVNRYAVSLNTFANGQITGNASPYVYSSTATLRAVANSGFVFSGWTGDASGTTNPLPIIMESNKTIGAIFNPDLSDSDSDGLSNYDELVVYGSNPNIKDSSSDGIEDGQAVALGYNPTLNFAGLISHLQSHPPTGLYTAQQYANNFTAGKDSVLNNPNSNGLYTTSQIQDMSMGGLVLSKNGNGFALNYSIEKSNDLGEWTQYQSFTLPLSGLSPEKAFVRLKMANSSSGSSSQASDQAAAEAAQAAARAALEAARAALYQAQQAQREAMLKDAQANLASAQANLAAAQADGDLAAQAAAQANLAAAQANLAAAQASAQGIPSLY